ncbi:MAG: hypothetical protein Q9157_002419 [Trypethelium eluteriae]
MASFLDQYSPLNTKQSEYRMTFLQKYVTVRNYRLPKKTSEVIAIGQRVKRLKKGDRGLAPTFGLNPTDKFIGEFGHQISWRVWERPARPQDRDFASSLFPMAEALLSQGLLKPHQMEIRTGGLETVAYGVDDLRTGRVRVKKLVYPMAT